MMHVALLAVSMLAQFVALSATSAQAPECRIRNGKMINT
jgi:hypothetical protein